jgi:hypothetical protein
LLDEWVPADGKQLASADYESLAQAFLAAGEEAPAYQTARKYRLTAEYFPATEVVKGASFTAHREAASRAGSAKAARNVMQGCVNAFNADPENKGKVVVITRSAVKAEAERLSKSSNKSNRKPKAGNGAVSTLSVAVVSKALDSLRVKDHYEALSVADLTKFVGVLKTTADKVERHITARQAKGATAPIKPASQPAPASKPASKGKGKAPASVRGSK